jgi:hypothetical protein
MRTSVSALVMALLSGVLVVVTQQPAAAQCPPEKEYDVTSSGGAIFAQVGPAVRADNQTPETNSVDVSNTASGTVSLSVTASGSWSASVILEGVKLDLGITVYASLTVTLGLTAHVTLPPHSVRYARFGVFRELTNGTYYIFKTDCTTTSFSAGAYSPYYIGYRITTS